MREVASQMDAIEADFGSEFQIGRVITIAEVYAAGEITLRVRALQLPWVSEGMLEWAKRGLAGTATADSS